MKNLGWAYVILFVLDSVLSIAASFVQSLSGVSNLLSTVMILFSVVVLLLAALRRLEPRWLFLTLPCGYLAVAIIIGTVMGVALAATVSPDAMPTNPTPDFMAAHISWYWAAHWSSVLGLAALSVLGLVKLIDSQRR